MNYLFTKKEKLGHWLELSETKASAMKESAVKEKESGNV
jgi:hypothetical protein